MTATCSKKAHPRINHPPSPAQRSTSLPSGPSRMDPNVVPLPAWGQAEATIASGSIRTASFPARVTGKAARTLPLAQAGVLRHKGALAPLSSASAWGWRQLDEATWLCELPPNSSAAIKDNVSAAYMHLFVFSLKGEKVSLTTVVVIDRERWELHRPAQL